MAERGGFEPPVRLPVRRISSAVLSTAQPPFRGRTPNFIAPQVQGAESGRLGPYAKAVATPTFPARSGGPKVRECADLQPSRFVFEFAYERFRLDNDVAVVQRFGELP